MLSSRGMRALIVSAIAACLGATLVPFDSSACSLVDRPRDAHPLNSGDSIAETGDAGSDTTAPSRAVLSDELVHLVRNGCNGSGAACPQLDWLQVTVSASDDRTPEAELRYVAYFGPSADAVRAQANPEIVFHPESLSGTLAITAWLGFNGQRDEKRFSATNLCFAVISASLSPPRTQSATSASGPSRCASTRPTPSLRQRR
jgi:hypothetical protein